MAEPFGKYELLQRIGVGGMAEVFRAKTFGAEGFVKQIVIKRILPALNEDPDFVRMFINEARLAARLQHANIVQVFEFDHVERTYYIAMEWVDGTDLRRVQGVARRRQQPIPPSLAIHVGVETLKGLHYAHTRAEGGQPLGLVHRDISPHNLLVSFAGEVKIADFGIAKAAALASATRSGVVKGKLTYMAPEQVRGAAVDARTDIFALGIVLWELLTGRRPYSDAASEAEVVARVQLASIPSARSLEPTVPPGLDAVLTCMLAADPDARYQSAAEALTELGAQGGGVADALEAAAYLRGLMPAEALRDQRGLTRIEKADRSRYTEAPPDAATRTRDDEPATTPVRRRAAGAAERPPPQPEGAVDPVAPTGLHRPQSVPQQEPTPAARDGSPPLDPGDRPPHVGRGRLLLAVSIALAAGLLGWIVAVPPSSPGRAPHENSPPPAPVVVIAVDARPPPADSLPDASPARQDREQRSRSADGGLVRAGQAVHVRQARARPARRRPIPRGWGTLRVIVEPWANVQVDGEPIGMTPVRAHRLATGRHTVELNNPELNQRERVRIRVGADQRVVLRRRWDSR